MQALFQDLRYTLRQLRKSPGFATVAVLTLALGIGANTAIYSIIHGALQLPYANADRMVVVKTVYPRRSYFAASWPDFLEWRSRNQSFTEIAGLYTDRMTWRGGSEPEGLNIGLITEDYFRMYGMRPILGRGLLPSDHKPGATPVCALSETFWREQLQSDASIVGKPLDLDGKTCTIVGVMPKMVPDSNHPAQVWIPMEPNPPFRERGTDFLLTVGLLRPGVSQAQALAELHSIQSQVNKQFPDNAHSINLQTLSQNVFGTLRPVMYILLTAVGFILLIACVNLANMLLARAAGRAREFAVRRALGASSRRVLQQALTESLLLSAIGGLVGLGFAAILTHIPIAAWPKGFVPLSGVHLDSTVLSFTTLLALATGIFFGMIPAIRILRQDAKSALQQGRTATESREQNRTRSILVIAEIALSMLLVAGSLNMAFYYTRLMRIDPGVNPRHVLSMGIPLPPNRSSDVESDWRFYSRLRQTVAALPGVVHVAGTLVPPFWGASPSSKLSYDKQPKGSTNLSPFANYDFVTPDYFSAVQTPILQGRDFSPQDRPDSPKVAIVNRGLAEKLWPGRTAIGKHIHCCVKDGDFTIIGVAGNARLDGTAGPAADEIYICMEQIAPPALTLLVRTAGDPFAIVNSVRHAVSSLNPDQPISNVTSLEILADQTVAGQRSSAFVTAILGILALLLASIGVYGVMAYSVSRRQREFGIRIALGSSRSGILKLLYSGVFPLVTLGIVLGTVLSIATRRWIASLLGANGSSSMALVTSALLLCVIAILAAFIPARRASRIDPMQTLRTE